MLRFNLTLAERKENASKSVRKNIFNKTSTRLWQNQYLGLQRFDVKTRQDQPFFAIKLY